MNDTEIGALRQKLASRVRSDDYRQRRKDMDAPVRSSTRLRRTSLSSRRRRTGYGRNGPRPRMTPATRH